MREMLLSSGLFSGLEAQGELNRMEEFFGPEQAFRRGAGKRYEAPGTFGEREEEGPGRVGLKLERVLEPIMAPAATL